MRFGHVALNVIRPATSRLVAMLVVACVTMSALVGFATGQETEPIMRVTSSGSTSFVSSLRFSADGKRLYSAGFDKIVRVWEWNEASQQFEINPTTIYRVPIGPGIGGLINTMSISPDGRWLVVGGTAPMRGANVFRKPGGKFPRRGGLTPEMRLDEGRLFVFDTATREMKVIRRHQGSVLATEFLTNSNRYLVCAANEWDRVNEETIGVVRLFDVETGDYVAGAVLPELKTRPAIAPLNETDDPKEAQIALSWGDGSLRIWSVGTQGMYRVADGTRDNSTAVFLPSLNRLVTGTFNQQQRAQGNIQQGELNLWTVPDRGGSPRKTGSPAAMRADQNRFPFATSLNLLQRQDGVSVVVANRMFAAQNNANASNLPTWQVRLFDVTDNGFRSVAQLDANQVPVSDRFPILAASPQGDWFAVAGSLDQAIRVFKTSDFRANRTQPFQTLVGEGIVLASAEFIEKDGEVGILLEDRNDNKYVFDVARRMVTEGNTGWSSYEADQQGWNVRYGVRQVDDPDQNQQLQTTVRVSGGTLGGRTVEIELDRGQLLKAAALLPVSDARELSVEFPILALASWGQGSPKLMLYNAETGESFRQFTGHVDEILSASFSRDGRYLVTTAVDQTVCVWNVNDVDAIYGVRGGVNGLALDNRDERVVVVDAASNQANSLQVNDIIASVKIDDREIKIETSRQFYALLWKTTPGTEIEVQLAGGATRPLTVEQGIDDRKPLFSMYLEPDEVDGQLEWVAWSPLGPFDSSGGEIETRLGWHFNGADDSEPVRFAHLSEYPEQRREGLVAQMLAAGKLPEVLPPPLDAPLMTLRFPNQSETESYTEVVSHPHERIDVSVFGLNSRQIKSIELLVDGEAAGQFEFSNGQIWSATLPEDTWSRGVHRFTARLTTNEIRSQEFEQSYRIEYVVAAPQLTSELDRQIWTTDAELALTALIQPSNTEPVDIHLIHRFEREDVEKKSWETTERFELAHKVTLKEGWNYVRIEAINRNAPIRRIESEASSLEFAINYEPSVEKPAATIEAFILAEGADELNVALNPSEVSTIEYSKPSLVLRSEYEDELPEISVSLVDEQGNAVAVTEPQFEKIEEAWFAVLETEIEAPGVYSLKVSEADSSRELFKSQIQRVAILPEITIVSPLDGDSFVEGKDAKTVEVKAQLEPATSAEAFEVKLRLNGELSEAEATIDNGLVTVEVELVNGQNEIEFTIENQYRRSQSDTLLVDYRQPPQIDSVEGEVGENPISKIVVAAKSVSEIRTVEVNGKRWNAEDWNAEEVDNQIVVTIHDVPLKAGDNQFEVNIANEDGYALESKSVAIRFEPPRELSPPRMDVLQPTQDAVIDKREFEFEFEVSSDSRLQMIDVYNGNELVFSVEDVIGIRPDTKGKYVARVKERLPLNGGPNHFRVVVINSDTDQTFELPIVTYQEPPVRLTIEGISLPGAPDQMIEPNNLGDGQIEFPEAIDSNVVYLHVVADWRGLDDSFRQENAPAIQILVNQFMQISNAKVDGDFGHFRFPIVLNKPENEIRVLLPHYKGEASSQSKFSLKTNRPTSNQHLHLLIVGIGVDREGGPELEERVLKSLRATRQPNGRDFETETFSRGTVHSVLVGSGLKVSEILDRLVSIQETVNLNAKDDDSLHVIMVYVEGGLVLAYEDQVLITTRPADSLAAQRVAEDPLKYQRYALFSGRLQDLVNNTNGAKVLLLDALEGNPDDLPSMQFNAESRAAMVRNMWIREESGARPRSMFIDVMLGMTRTVNLGEISRTFRETSAKEERSRYEDFLPEVLKDFVLVARQTQE